MNLTGTAYHPAFGEPVEFHAIPLSRNPETQVAQTIGHMRDAVRADTYAGPILRDSAEMEMTGDPCVDAFWKSKSKIKFQQDEDTAAPLRKFLDDEAVEVLISPRHLAEMRNPVEDCDGFTSYTAALLRSRGVPCNFATVAADAREPGRYSHVYLACYPPTGRIALDTSHGPYPGWEAPNVYGKKREWPIDGPDWPQLFLIGAVLAGAWYAARHWGIL